MKRIFYNSSDVGTVRGFCGPSNPCLAANTICDSGQCVCKSGFIEKWRKCGRVFPALSDPFFYLVPSLCSKPELEFQCDDATACIAIYDVCNGIAECPDASDELFCEKGLLVGIWKFYFKALALLLDFLL